MIKPVLFAAAVSLFAAPAFAADAPPAPVRTIVQSFPASGAPNQQVNVATVAFPAGAVLAYHTHPGEESGVVVSGLLKIEEDGKPPLLVKPGESFLIPRGVAHQASAPQGETHLISTYVVDKDKPLATPRP